MFRKKKETQFDDEPSKKDEDQILTRSRVREFNNNKKRNTWLNKAIIIVAILLAILIYAIFNL
ncbi:cell wall synthase accessory phosphoprotein MacP [Vagococcus carniphilus]|uniref:Cell wall synthase accessory phosphoprotein MacP n=1 Tax=Vagococcus carniphilus TaxID=218144 RepID=A0A430AWB1_9ENTE|nr:cell wall synthase accessory phosphoprotein MacP [Vagococcus carniphilus]MDT2815140.1 cell wall synthase accessory phosphoprotein MacP [Vagococcus carniphilus]MDT2831626.1 cell wall synthase accessory phosphoprotein MacP [Vagococcus carniphilus]MDT2834052.1 cell wall synthase accessory phosphoprotein MacP [Vagococcus carniphilus]MDT2840466.1 cell wall synthase accessory phosphoprotein MacP [Vagococcus carniphilus]MDT2849896.1 cell wall synthase accessory phosphoprotein MacP [Vagococcus carn